MHSAAPPAADASPAPGPDPLIGTPLTGASVVDTPWVEFAAALRRGELTTSTLARWTGSPVSIGDLERDPAGQRRRITLLTRVDKRVVTLCQATAWVNFEVLPGWVRHVLDSTHQPLGRTLYRVGAQRRWDCGVVVPTDQLEAAQSCRGCGGAQPHLVVRATFVLPGQEDVIAAVEETFHPTVLGLRSEHFDAGTDAERPERLIDDTDGELVGLLRLRRQLTQPRRSADGSPPPVYPVHNDLLRAELIATFGRKVGGAMFTAITLPAPAVSIVELPATGQDQSRTA